jgi:hypothetical protein
MGLLFHAAKIRLSSSIVETTCASDLIILRLRR